MITRPHFVLLAGLLAFVGTASPARAQSATSTAEALFQAGRALFDEGKTDEACKKLAEAQAPRARWWDAPPPRDLPREAGKGRERRGRATVGARHRPSRPSKRPREARAATPRRRRRSCPQSPLRRRVRREGSPRAHRRRRDSVARGARRGRPCRFRVGTSCASKPGATYLPPWSSSRRPGPRPSRWSSRDSSSPPAPQPATPPVAPSEPGRGSADGGVRDGRRVARRAGGRGGLRCARHVSRGGTCVTRAISVEAAAILVHSRPTTTRRSRPTWRTSPSGSGSRPGSRRSSSSS
jgi:hypothetical protein